ncbi:MAG: hypothetical protein ACLR4D_03670 [Faecalibacterium sp.]
MRIVKAQKDGHYSKVKTLQWLLTHSFYVWLTIGVNPVYVDTGIRIESAADLCGRCLDDVATDVLYMTGNDHALEAADPLELAEIKRRWEPYINQLPDYAYLCKDLLNGKM